MENITDVFNALKEHKDYIKEMKKENLIISAIVILLGVIVVIFSSLH